MIIIGMALAWGGYAMVFYGYSLVRGYSITLSQVVSPTGYYKGSWPPALASGTSIFPGQSGGTGASGTAGAGSGIVGDAEAGVQGGISGALSELG
jgi:hypothetical protein